MNPAWVEVCIVAFSALCSFGSIVVNLQMRAALAEMRAAAAEARTRDREETRTWINGSFMRSKEVEKEFDGFKSRLSSLESAAHNWGVERRHTHS